jgi:transposase
LAALDGAPEALAIDETCIYFEEAPRYGYALKGERCVFRRKQPQRTGKVTLLMAISERRGVVASKVVTGSVNAAIFASFVDGIDARRGSVAILDNVSFHKTNVVREAAERKGLSFIFIPPYSPEFNPIEGTFSVLKAALRSGLQQDLEAALATITLTKCQSFFRASRRHATDVGSGLESAVVPGPGPDRGAGGAMRSRSLSEA